MGSEIDAVEINSFIRPFHSSSYRYDQSRNPEYLPDPRWASEVMASCLGGGDDDYLQYADAQSEYTTAPTGTSRASTSTRSAAPRSIFDGSDDVQSLPSTAPSDRPRQMTFVGQYYGPHTASTAGIAPRRPGQILWCEFYCLENCHETFDLGDQDGWIKHHIGHLGDSFPQKLMCWFCDHVPLDAANTNDAYANFLTRMEHIRGHILDNPHLTSNNTRRDLRIVEHMYQQGLMSESKYRVAMEYDETPEAFRLPGLHSRAHASSHPRPLDHPSPYTSRDGRAEDHRRKPRRALGRSRQ
ncbi:hypothetical protein C8A00DRAFT_13832 [Chaetomidium leptoderma]|uniref:Uncharacterized protein n=1 Tax=Chaetomidium leptoderma TaxID=669021 RepID=A0AAN6VNY0_9PEZI|nr:hypothetical protein C8A00DRAFT_13832 [Chaetomidium leptoderma]